MRSFRAPGAALRRGLAAVAISGGVVFLAGLLLHPARAWAGLLGAFTVLATLALAGPMFLSFLFASRARWADPLHPVLEAMASVLPAAGALGVVLLFGIHSLYEWSHETVVAANPVLLAKKPWLSTMPFSVRTLFCLGAWIVLSRWLIAGARAGTGEDAEAVRRRRTTRAGVFLIVFTVTFSVASVDWWMSLEPHWFSTIYALQALAGLGLSGLAAATILAIHLRRAGPLEGVVDERSWRDCGTLLFSLAVFWAYIAYCQWMLVWYTNMPEETSWYELRNVGTWGLLSNLSLVLNGALPFLLLLSRRMRDRESMLLRVCGILLLGRAVEVLVLVGPPILGDVFPVDLFVLGPVTGALALFFHQALRHLHGRVAGEERVAALPAAGTSPTGATGLPTSRR